MSVKPGQLHDEFVDIYNNRRAHTSIGKVTPAVAYNRLPKDQPGNSSTQTHYRIRHDRNRRQPFGLLTGAVSLRRAGRMHHIGIGRKHKHTAVILIIDDLDIRIINTNTGELLRHLTLNPNTGYQPRFKT